MEQPSIVPNDGIARSPRMVVNARWLASEINQILKKFLRLFGIHAGNPVRVSPNDERSASSFGMDLHQRSQWGIKFVETVTRAYLWLVAQFGLAIPERVISR